MRRFIAAEAVRVTLWTVVLCLVVALVTALGPGTSAAANAHAQPQERAASGERPGGAASVSAERALEAKLRAARSRLRQDAQAVAELSMQLGAGLAPMGRMGPVVQIRGRAYGGPGAAVAVTDEHFGPGRLFFSRFGRGVVGLQVDPASGRKGARVLEVSPGGPADDAGIRPGDIIVAVNGARISGPETARQVLEHLGNIPPKRRVTLEVLRRGKTRDFELTTLPPFSVYVASSGPLGGGPMPPFAPMGAGRPGKVLVARRFGEPYLPALSAETAGMVLASLTPKLGSYFGTENGVLVLRAPSDDVFRLEDGDVILSIGGREPMNGAHATRILGTYGPGERLVLEVMRHRKRMTLKITLPKGASR